MASRRNISFNSAIFLLWKPALALDENISLAFAPLSLRFARSLCGTKFLTVKTISTGWFFAAFFRITPLSDALHSEHRAEIRTNTFPVEYTFARLYTQQQLNCFAIEFWTMWSLIMFVAANSFISWLPQLSAVVFGYWTYSPPHFIWKRDFKRLFTCFFNGMITATCAQIHI